MIKNVVFDLGGVLVNFNPGRYLEKMGYNKNEVDLFTKLVFYGEEWDKYNASKFTFDKTKENLIKRYPEYSFELTKILDNIDYNYILFEMKENSDYLKELKNNGYNIYILSDMSKESYQFNKEFEFFKYIDGGVYSFEINSTKPSEKNYKTLLERFNLVPEETIFIDDRINNIEVANQFKIKGILFTNLDEVKKKIQSYQKQ